jgi:pectate lyase
MKTRIELLQRAAILPAVLLLAHCSSAPDSEPSDSPSGGAAGTTAAAGSSQTTAGSGPTAGAGGSVNAGGGTKSSGGGAGTDPTSGSPAGGALTSGGASGLGGASGAGGNQPQAGATAGGSSAQAGMAGMAGTGGADPNDKTIPMTIPTPTNGQGEIRSGTTVLKNAKNGGKDIWDFGNQRIGVNNTADCEGGEGQLTVFEVEDGITVRNLIIPAGLPAGNGIVCKGNCNLEYVYWEDVCEDAATNSKDGATMRLSHVIALKATDKVFQHNAKGGSRTIIENSFISGFGKLWRSCGDCTDNGGPRHLTIDNVRVDGVTTAVAGANQNYGDTVTIKSLFVKGGYDAADDKPKICTEYLGVTDHNGESTKLGDGKSQWNTATCKVNQSEVKSY